MHIYFVGLGGTGIGPLALIAKKAGYRVSGSDKQASSYLENIKKNGIEAEVCIDESHLKITNSQTKVDWVVTTSAAEKELVKHPIIEWARHNGIKVTKRDEFLASLIKDKNLKLIAVSGTHGKTTTTAMLVWLFKQLGLPISFSVGAKLVFGEMGEFDEASEYFVYECDEYDRNFLAFYPFISIISGLAYDHPDVYPTKEDYNSAFKKFFMQSKTVIAWQKDIARAGLEATNIIALNDQPLGLASLNLPGEVNRRDARLAMQALAEITDEDLDKLAEIMNKFPGVSRRFELIAPNIYSDYAHTPDKIRGALQLAHEVAGENVVVVYEGLHNSRQHFIRSELAHLFDEVKKLYVVPSYRARENEALEDLTPEKLVGLISKPKKAEPSELNEDLKIKIKSHAENGDTVLCLTAGGGGSLDEWLRAEFRK